MTVLLTILAMVFIFAGIEGLVRATLIRQSNEELDKRDLILLYLVSFFVFSLGMACWSYA